MINVALVGKDRFVRYAQQEEAKPVIVIPTIPEVEMADGEDWVVGAGKIFREFYLARTFINEFEEKIAVYYEEG